MVKTDENTGDEVEINMEQALQMTQNGDTTTLAMSLLKQMSQKTVKAVSRQDDGYYTVTLTSSKEGEPEEVVTDTYRYKPKQESTGELLSLSFAMDSEGYLYIPKQFPTDKALSGEAKKSFFLLDNFPPTEVFEYEDEKKAELLNQMPTDYFPEVLPCEPTDLCPSKTPGADLPSGESDQTPTSDPDDQTQDEDKTETPEEEKGTNMTWLWILLSVIGVAVIGFLVYRFVINPRRGF
jgi:hypothetical protein